MYEIYIWIFLLYWKKSKNEKTENNYENFLKTEKNVYDVICDVISFFLKKIFDFMFYKEIIN